MTALVWLRNDLRMLDNPALSNACSASDDAQAIYVVCGHWQQRHAVAPVRNDFIRRSLQQLGQELAEQGIALEVLYVESATDVAPQLLAHAQRHHCDSLWFNCEYPLDEVRRDADVAQLFQQQGLAVHAFHDRVMVPPEQLRTQQGQCYRVFTPFKRQWLKQVASLDLRPLPAPRGGNRARFDAAAVDALFEYLPQRNLQDIWPAGAAEAHARLSDFAERKLEDYHQQRDFPAVDGTSSLSPYLAIGALSPRQCMVAALNQTEGDGQQPGVSTWISELAWRDFYQHLVAAFPRLSRGEPLVSYTEGFPWRGADDRFQRWCEGRTGIPIVDAAMRQLHQLGWMHNRLRMICAMFLTKNLQVDWRLGERFFMSHLIDGDFAANNGGWQWSASTGADAAPYFRIFNPVTQSQRFDPGGEFIRHYLPELARVSGKAIHQPPQIDGYPSPVVDLAASRRDTLELFKQLNAGNSLRR